MKTGKEALGSMSQLQIMAMSALGMAPSIVTPMLRLHGIIRPPFNLIISNVPGPKKPMYLNGARMTGTYPLSIPINGMALNITCNSYADDMDFGLTGCRRSVPHLQRLLSHLDDELGALEKAAGVSLRSRSGGALDDHAQPARPPAGDRGGDDLEGELLGLPRGR